MPGVEIATLGERARAVFRVSSRVAYRVDGRHVDVVLADTPAEAAMVSRRRVSRRRWSCSARRARWTISAPAFDPAVDNPIGWVREVEYHVAALGPAHLLPYGIKTRRVVTTADFLVQAEAVHPGWHPALAGIENAPPRPGPAGEGGAQ